MERLWATWRMPYIESGRKGASDSPQGCILCEKPALGDDRSAFVLERGRACYILLNDDTIHYRRVEYDVETTVKKIYGIDDLENFLGDRLREGR